MSGNIQICARCSGSSTSVACSYPWTLLVLSCALILETVQGGHFGNLQARTILESIRVGACWRTFSVGSFGRPLGLGNFGDLYLGLGHFGDLLGFGRVESFWKPLGLGHFGSCLIVFSITRRWDPNLFSYAKKSQIDHTLSFCGFQEPRTHKTSK